jgi:hypothetical protein
VKKLRGTAFTCLLLCAARSAAAQGCAMCYSNATASTEQGQKAVSKGVMVLLIPPVAFMTLGVWIAFSYGRKRDQEQEALSLFR